MASCSVTNLFTFLEVDINSIKRDENNVKFRDYAKINEYLRLFVRKRDGRISFATSGHFVTLLGLYEKLDGKRESRRSETFFLDDEDL